jgi:hypothetical protein
MVTLSAVQEWPLQGVQSDCPVANVQSPFTVDIVGFGPSLGGSDANSAVLIAQGFSTDIFSLLRHGGSRCQSE